jgi:hypothetical protein
MERKLKGSVALDMVKVVRAFPDQPWDRFLLPEDMEIVNSMIIPAEWYPIEFFQRVGLAVYKLVAKGNDEVVAQFARRAMKELYEGPYRPFLAQGDPFAATEKFLDLRRGLFNFSKMEMERTGEESLRVRISEFGTLEEGLDVFMLVLGVHFQELIKYNGGDRVNLDYHRETEAGQIKMVFELSWT